MARYEFSVAPDGTPVFRKFGPSGSDDRFLAEAEGLRALSATGRVRTPAIVSVTGSELVTERIAPGEPTGQGWRELGAALGEMHSLPQPCFGFTGDNYCGDTPQPNPKLKDGHLFFAQHRLAPGAQD